MNRFFSSPTTFSITLGACLLACGGQTQSGSSNDVSAGGNAGRGTGSRVSSTIGGSTIAGGTVGSGGSGFTSPASTGSGGTAVTSTGTDDPCARLTADYGVAVEQVTTCNPVLSSRQCQALHFVGLNCGCRIVVNAQRSAALDQIDAIAAAWKQLSCDAVPDPVLCGPCQPVEPDSIGGGCSPEGKCLAEFIE